MPMFKDVPFCATAHAIKSRTPHKVLHDAAIAGVASGGNLHQFLTCGTVGQYGDIVGVSTWGYVNNLERCVLYVYTPTHVLIVMRCVATWGYNVVRADQGERDCWVPNYTNPRNPAAGLLAGL